MKNIEQQIESLIFASDTPTTVSEIIECLSKGLGLEINEEAVVKTINQIDLKYRGSQFSFRLQKVAGGYTFLTKPDFHSIVSVLIQQKSNKKLSKSALETLSIIAYKQPVTKVEVEHIRGVSTDYSVNRLMEKELIEIAGRSDAPGKPLIYKTTKRFMDYFGINSIEELPKLKDLKQEEENEIGTPVES